MAWLTEPMGGSPEGQRSPGPLLKEEILEGAGADSPGNMKQLKHEPVVEETKLTEQRALAGTQGKKKENL